MVRMMVMLALAACSVEDESRPGTQIGDDGAEVGWGCVEVSRDAISDSSVPAEGFSDSPDAAEAAVSGAFLGTWTQMSGDGVDISLGITSDGAWEVVRLEEPEVDGTQDIPAIYLGCFDYYSRAASVELVSSPELDEVVAAELMLYANGDAEVQALVAVADLVGTALPADFDPAETNGALVISASSATGEDQWMGNLMFSGSLEGSGDEPSVAFIENYGGFLVERDEG
jgi:hypothetical protein